MRRENIPGTILIFALGAGLGAVAALLLAPKSGEELRGDIADGVNDGVSQVRNTGRELKKRAQRAVDAARDQVQDAIDAGDNAYNQAKRSS
jgi:gas vesicle protein